MTLQYLTDSTAQMTHKPRTKRSYKGFIRSGAKLDTEDKKRLAAINERLAGLGTQFSQNVLKDESSYALFIEDEAGLDTYDTCVRARDVFGVHELLLVSQEYHLARAVATCRAVGVDAVGVSDTSVQGISNFWAYGTAREYAANVKMAFDVVSRRAPRQEPPSDAVREALRA